MKSQRVQRSAEDNSQHATDQAQGLAPSHMHLFPHRAASMQIADIDKLEAVPSSATLQAADGKFIFLVGYSVLGGGDVLG